MHVSRISIRTPARSLATAHMGVPAQLPFLAVPWAACGLCSACEDTYWDFRLFALDFPTLALCEERKPRANDSPSMGSHLHTFLARWSYLPSSGISTVKA